MSTPIPNPAAVGADPEVHAKAKRRRFTAEYKANVLAEIDAVEDPGGVGAILRREGLYSSHLTEWRRARAERGLSGLQPQKRGRKAKPEHLVEIEKLQRRLARAEERARRAELIVEAQKKLCEVLGLPLNDEQKTGATP